MRSTMRSTTRSSTRSLLLATALLFAVAACGGGDKGTGPGPGPITETVATVDVSAPVTTFAPQQTAQFTATTRSATGSVIGGVATVWSSSANAVATVNSFGLVTGVAAGTATITATAAGKTGSVTVTVTSGAGVLSSVTVNAQDRDIQLGQFTQATVAGVDGQGAPIALGNRVVTWTTSNPSIAAITNAGVVTGVGVGTVNLQASVADGAAAPKTASVSITVAAIPNAPTTARVDMFGTGVFIPFEVVVKQNGVVSFIFPSIVHNVIWDRRLSGAPADIGSLADQTVTRSFPTVGVFNYTCTLHPGMDGVVVVSP